MFVGTASLCFIFLFAGFFVSADPKIITAVPGQDVTLTCQAPNKHIIVVKWSRADLGDEYVLLYRDGHFAPDHQHPSFKNRVDLQDRQMKDGDVSLILKDVKINDAGTYVCRVFMTRKRRSWHLISTTDLHVDPPGQSGGFAGPRVGLSVAVGLLVTAGIIAVLGLLIYKKLCQGSNSDDPQSKEPFQKPSDH
ncbi:programmed cell death 1 ligand 1-like [Simochromis diagramma]|uniref:programmed cell death 1 ligand 1-like n=1 Tax=Simochromis diagramma TaxID=43689 RepID=UPI001A7EE999|nr:programmed cell death 1 ligand 1-like [Simochromis diagramma]